MKASFIKFTLHISFLAICVIVPSNVIQSCGPSLATDESRFALFRQGLDGNSGLLPFNYSESVFNFTETDPAKQDYKRNCAEWMSFCGGGVKTSDIYRTQYTMSPDAFLVSYAKGNWSEFKGNTFIEWLLKKENHAALEYMALAKEAENTQFKNTDDPWDTSGVSIDTQCEAIAIKAGKAAGRELPVFLKERYAFQAIKMYYYNDNKKSNIEQLHKLYEEYLQQSKSIIAGWALVYYGMSQYNKNQRTISLLQAFDKTEEKKEFCYLQISAGDLRALEKTTGDTGLLLLINTLKTIKNKGKALDQIKSVYQYNPDSKYLPLLITREINKLENWLWSPEMLYFSENYRPEFENNENIPVSFKEKLKQKDRQYLEEVRSFIENIASKSTSCRPFLQLALAHLCNMQHEFVKAQETLEQMGNLSNPKLETQQLIEKVITTAQVSDITRVETQQKLTGFIKKLIVLNPAFRKQIDKEKNDIWEHEDTNERNNDLSELFILLSHCFEKKGNIVMAGLLHNRANITVNNYDGWIRDDNTGYNHIAYFDRYASPKDMDKLLAFKHKKNKTQFERLVSPKTWGLDDQYEDLKGTILFRLEKYREALAVFDGMDAGFWVSHYEYSDYLPLATVTHTGKLVPSEKTIPAPYIKQGKAAIVKDIVSLLNAIPRVKNDDEKARLYYKLANAYFNTSYNGKAWMMFSYGKSSGEMYYRGTGNYNWAWFDFYPNSVKYADYYYRCSDAIMMYKKSLSLATDKELAAKCLLSLSVCDKIRHDNIESSGKGFGGNTTYYPAYLQKLKSGYSSTNAFKEAAIECPDVKDFLSKN